MSPLVKYPSSVTLKITNSARAEGLYSVLVSGRKNVSDGVVVDITKLLDFSREYEISFMQCRLQKASKNFCNLRDFRFKW